MSGLIGVLGGIFQDEESPILSDENRLNPSSSYVLEALATKGILPFYKLEEFSFQIPKELFPRSFIVVHSETYRGNFQRDNEFRSPLFTLFQGGNNFFQDHMIKDLGMIQL